MQVAHLPKDTEVSKEAVKLAEVLTQKLLALDGVDVTTETRQLRKAQINRINLLWYDIFPLCITLVWILSSLKYPRSFGSLFARLQ